jgi:hypothetical protein
MWDYVSVTDVDSGEDVTVDAADVLDSLSFTNLSDWCNENGFTVLNTWEYDNLCNNDGFITLKENYSKQDLYQFLCDLVRTGYYTSKEDVLNKLSDLF